MDRNCNITDDAERRSLGTGAKGWPWQFMSVEDVFNTF
jgi:hypothetical protein